MVLCSRILVAYDGSNPSQRALKKALEIGKIDPAIEIHVVHVIKLPEMTDVEQNKFQALVDDIYQKGNDTLEETEEALAELPNQSRTFLLEGRAPAYVILSHAKEHNCDLIILGNRGLSGIKEFLGSVSHTVVQRSRIPVLIMK